MTTDEPGRIIRAERRAQGLRQDQLAGAAGVGVRFLSELECGKTTARVGKVLAVLAALGCKVRIEPPPRARHLSGGGKCRVSRRQPPRTKASRCGSQPRSVCRWLPWRPG